MKLAELLSDMIAAGATIEQVSAVVEASKRQDDAREVKRREQTAERVKRHRQKKKDAVTRVTQVTNETRYTDPHLSGSEDIYPPSPPTGAQTPKGVPTPPARGSRIDPTWRPTETDREYAFGEGLTEGEIQREAEKFRDHWCAKAGADAAKRDWPATWRTWVRRSVERRPSGHVNGARAGPAPRERRNPHFAALEAAYRDDP